MIKNDKENDEDKEEEEEEEEEEEDDDDDVWTVEVGSRSLWRTLSGTKKTAGTRNHALYHSSGHGQKRKTESTTEHISTVCMFLSTHVRYYSSGETH